MLPVETIATVPPGEDVVLVASTTLDIEVVVYEAEDLTETLPASSITYP